MANFLNILEKVHLLAEQILISEEFLRYEAFKRKLQSDFFANKLLLKFSKIKEEFLEAQRFGVFHPDFHSFKEKAYKCREELLTNDLILQYFKAEEDLDNLLYEVSKILAAAISDDILVLGNKPLVRGCKCKNKR